MRCHFAHDLNEDLIDVVGCFGRCFEQRTVPRLGQQHSLFRRHFSLKLQVGLVAHENKWHPVGALYSHDLVFEGTNVRKGLLGGRAVHYDEALAILDVEVAHGRELLRSRRVQYLQHRRCTVHTEEITQYK